MKGTWARCEEGLLVACLAAIVSIPLVEAILRKTLNIGIAGSATLVQHLTLVAAMAGSALAARDDKLLALFSLPSLFGAGAQAACRFASRTFAACVAGVLFVASVRLVLVEHAAGSILAYDIPVWVAQSVLPAGFLLMAMRLANHAGSSLKARIAAAGVVLVMLAASPFLLERIAVLFHPALALVALCALLGAPVFAIIAGVSLLLFVEQGAPIASVPLDHYRMVVNPTLPSIPLFALAGYLFAESGAPRRLIEVFDAFFGRMRGGAALATVLACTFFTSFTGASGVTILALGGLVMPLLLAKGYAPKTALGLVTAAGLPGTLLMPALPLILYAIVAGVSIQEMFLAGALPAVLMLAIVAAWGMVREPPQARTQWFDWARARPALAAAKWELLLPLVPIGALAGGLATPVETAALTVLLAFLITTVAHRDLTVSRDVPRVAVECGLIVGGMLLILGLVLGLTDCLVDAQVPERIVAWVRETVTSRTVFLLALNAFLLLAGCVMEIYPAILVLVPLIAHLGPVFGIHPLHLGAIFLANMELGYLTPLVGLNLFFASYRFNKPVLEIFRAALPLFLAVGAGVLVVTFVPWLSTALPAALR